MLPNSMTSAATPRHCVIHTHTLVNTPCWHKTAKRRPGIEKTSGWRSISRWPASDTLKPFFFLFSLLRLRCHCRGHTSVPIPVARALRSQTDTHHGLGWWAKRRRMWAKLGSCCGTLKVGSENKHTDTENKTKLSADKIPPGLSFPIRRAELSEKNKVTKSSWSIFFIVLGVISINM